jgi:uncharacterized membrane protein
MTGVSRRSWWQILVSPVNLSGDEKRTRRRAVRVLIYGYGAVLLLLVVVFPRPWLPIALAWVLIGAILFTWLNAVARGNVLRSGWKPSQFEVEAGRTRLSRALTRASVFTVLCGALLCLAGTSAGPRKWWFIGAGLVVVAVGVPIVLWARRLRSV